MRLKRVIIILMVCMMTLTVVACGKESGDAKVAGSYRIVKLVEMLGEVTYSRDNKTEKVYLNMNFENGDMVSTGVESSATISLDDDKRLVMGADTSIVMMAEGDKKNSRTIITLEQGEIINVISEKLAPEALYEIKTSNSTIGVYGTTFYVKAEGDKTVVYCDEGVVEVEADDTAQKLEPGQAVKVEADAVTIMSPEEFEEEMSPEMLEELEEEPSDMTEGGSANLAGGNEAGTQIEDGGTQSDTLPNGAVLEADGYYWKRDGDGYWIKYDAAGRYVEERGRAQGANGEPRYRISKYVTDEHGFNYMYQMDVYDSATDALVEAYIYHYDFVEERPIDDNEVTVTKKLWYTYYYEETVKKIRSVQVEKTVYISGTNSWDEDGWN